MEVVFMCCIETKKKIYEEFENGLDPQQVIVKLNIPGESKVVYGCYSYYKNKKVAEEEKENILQEELNYSNELIRRYKESIQNLSKYGREFLNVLKESKDLEVHKRYDAHTFARQILLHEVENGKYDEGILDKMHTVSKTRRNYKRMDDIEVKMEKIKRDLNNVIVAIENLTPIFIPNEDNGTELYINGRMKNMDEYYMDIISAVR